MAVEKRFEFPTLEHTVGRAGNGIRTNYQTASFVVGLRNYVVQFGFGGLIV